MIILVTSKYQNPRYIHILEALKYKNVDIRYVNDISNINDKLISEIKPDLMLSDYNNAIRGIPHLLIYSDKTVDNPTDMGFCLEDLPPFINPYMFSDPVSKKEFESDICFIGDTNKLSESLGKYLNMEYKVKFFGAPSHLWCYCGTVKDNEIQHVYKSSKCPIALEDDVEGQYYIIASDNHPCVCKSDSDIESAWRGKYQKHIKKEELFKHHTNVARLNFLLNKFKLRIT